MLASETNGYRIDEMVRRSETRRRASEATRSRRGSRLEGMKRMASVAAAMAMWPLKH